MNSKNEQFDDFSLKALLDNIKNWSSFMKNKSKEVIQFSFLFLLLLLTYNYIKSPIHYAKTTFVLDSQSSSSSIGDVASLASLAGINASSFIDASGLFQIDNIQELYKSNSMIIETLLSKSNSKSDNKVLINHFGETEKIDKKWKKLGVNFDEYIVFKNNQRLHDSILMEAAEIIKDKYLIVDKPSRKTTILEIGFDHKDELLAKNFNENLVSIVNDFYFKTKTQKSGKNLEILQRQRDSVKKVLDRSVLDLANEDQRVPNPNPLAKTNLVPYQKALIEVQSNGAIYQQVVTQLELAKVTHRNNTPLIQIIDKPTLPLENSRLKFFECLIYGLFGGLLIAILYFSLLRFYHSLIK
tara:strand:+ start:8748 stop:9812 length:1065 start_codon:yes stop_codon:yes gene_type:complete